MTLDIAAFRCPGFLHSRRTPGSPVPPESDTGLDTPNSDPLVHLHLRPSVVCTSLTSATRDPVYFRQGGLRLGALLLCALDTPLTSCRKGEGWPLKSPTQQKQGEQVRFLKVKTDGETSRCLSDNTAPTPLLPAVESRLA